MKMLHSYWSKPFYESNPDGPETRVSGGWPHGKYYYMSWAFSCLQLSRYYSRVELVTDRQGYQVLVEQLQLPYTDVRVELDRFNRYPPELWAVGKLHTYAIQEEPFLHIDCDLFIPGPFSKQLLNRPVIAQHAELGYRFYNRVYGQILEHCPFIPGAIKNNCTAEAPINAYNMGLAGGHDLDFFKRLAGNAFEFIERNYDYLGHHATGQMNTIFEQVLCYYMLQDENKKMALYTPITGERKVDFEMKSFTHFKGFPQNNKVLHLYGTCKLVKRFATELERKFKRMYPGYYARIMDMCYSRPLTPLDNDRETPALPGADKKHQLAI
ncbi:MAG: hypothetical protein JNM68_05215 [Dinghuibacter sp.]|nr:hypothetical protein [Dinghuibacter sp.]